MDATSCEAPGSHYLHSSGAGVTGRSLGAPAVEPTSRIAGQPVIQRRWWLVAATPLIATLIALVPLSGTAASQPTPTPTTQDARTAELQRRKLEQEVEKLRQDVRKLDLENDRAAGGWGLLLALAPFLTVLVAVGTLGVNFFVQSRNLAQEHRSLLEQQRTSEEQSQQWREEFLRQQQKDSADREQESLRRFDENLARIVSNLGSPTLPLQVNAAAALVGFLKPRYAELHCDLLAVVVANLKLRPDSTVSDLLRHDLERAVRLIFDPSRDAKQEIGDALDLTRLDLSRVNLWNVNFQGVAVDLAFSTLKQADLRGCNLTRARGLECDLDGALLSRAILEEARFNGARGERVQFHEARLVSATFKDTVLPRAQFERASLQGAHFDGADLTGARFKGADLADAFFTGAVLDTAAKTGIARGALRWRNARFDPAIREELIEISEGVASEPSGDGKNSTPPGEHSAP